MMNKITLNDIVNVNSGLNIISNNGIGFKDIELSFELSLFKEEAEKLVKHFLETTKDKPQEEKELLLEKETKLELPKITLAQLKSSSQEIPLLAINLLRKCITK